MSKTRHLRITLGSIDESEEQALHAELRPILEQFYRRDQVGWYDVSKYEYRSDMRGPHPLNAGPSDWHALYGNDDEEGMI
jgi:hypothetical protein